MEKEEVTHEKYENEKQFVDVEPQVNLEEEDDSPIEEVRVTISSKYLLTPLSSYSLFSLGHSSLSSMTNAYPLPCCTPTL